MNTTTTKPNAREAMLTYVRDLGWELDPTSTFAADRFSSQRVQDPYTFRRNAADGGTWRLHLDYTKASSGWLATIGPLLRVATLTYIPANVDAARISTYARYDLPDGVHRWELKNTDKSSWSETSWLWHATGRDTDGTPWYHAKRGEPRPMRQRAEMLARDPETAVWIAAEARDADIRRRDVQAQVRAEDQRLRERPLPITVTRAEFRTLTARARDAANGLYTADGKTDLPAVLAELRAATAAIEGVIAR